MKRFALVAMLLALTVPAPASAGESWRDKVSQFASEKLQESLTYSHSRRDYALAGSLAAADHVTLDDDVLFAAAMLHDMGGVSAYAEGKKDHADVSAAKIDLVLGSTDFPKAKLDAVRAAIRTHNPDRKPVGAEARYLHDADILDNLGASGVAWLLELADSNGGKPTPQQLLRNFNDTTLFEKGVLTPAGKAELAIRVAEQKSFLNALRRETDGFKNL